MDAMVVVWAVFTLMLFVIEPLVHRRSSTRSTNRSDAGAPDAQAGGDAERRFARIVRMHWVLLGVSFVTIAGAVAGSHGYLLFSR
jgi:hypothetical protein